MGVHLQYWCILIIFCGYAYSETNHNDDDDTIVIEAASDLTSHRKGRQFLTSIPYQLQHPFFIPQNDNLGSNALLTGPCITSKGVVGRCMSFRQCYPYFKLPDLNNWDSWILGMYDTCSYYTVQGRQMFGVCCTSPPNPVSSTETPLNATETSTTTEKSEEQNPESIKIPDYPYPGTWPPPFITHPSDHNTIPPLPTHPPSPGYPIFVGYPTNPVYPLPAPTPAVPLPLPVPVPVPVTDSSCGAKNGYQDQERIVGGQNADLGEWPWIAGLFNAGRQFCGGSLIDNIHILSAAHCVAHMSSWDVARLTVRLGDYNIRTNSEVKHVEKKVKRVVRHRGFDSRTLYNDVAIITLDTPIKFNQQIRPICLPQHNGDTYAGKTGTVIGWGSIRESGPQPAILQEVSIPIWDNRDCRIKYGAAAPGGIVEHMICAGQARRDSCSGDSGGPLMVNTGKWLQAGIVSWGIGCGKGQYPGVYTRVQTFLPWILKNLKQ